jgi:hypothetical protein
VAPCRHHLTPPPRRCHHHHHQHHAITMCRPPCSRVSMPREARTPPQVAEPRRPTCPPEAQALPTAVPLRGSSATGRRASRRLSHRRPLCLWEDRHRGRAIPRSAHTMPLGMLQERHRLEMGGEGGVSRKGRGGGGTSWI